MDTIIATAQLKKEDIVDQIADKNPPIDSH